MNFANLDFCTRYSSFARDNHGSFDQMFNSVYVLKEKCWEHRIWKTRYSYQVKSNVLKELWLIHSINSVWHHRSFFPVFVIQFQCYKRETSIADWKLNILKSNFFFFFQEQKRLRLIDFILKKSIICFIFQKSCNF